MANLLHGDVGHLPLGATWRAVWFPDEPVLGQGTHLGSVREDFSVICPIWQDAQDESSVSVNERGEFFHTNAILPNTAQPFPDELWNIRFGTSYSHLFDNGWIAGASVSFGSASDKPFHGLDEMTAGVNSFLRIPSGEHNAWLFTLSYSVTSELPFPIPGVAYIYEPSDQFRAVIGLPFQLMYRPVEDLTLDFSYMLLRTVHARATYRVWPRVRLYAAFDWENESYLLANRPSDNDRFFYYDMRLTGGVQLIVGKHVSVDLAGGYTFDRFYFEAAQYSGNNFNRLNIGDGPFAAIQFQARW
jgi:hypothetical protein